MINNYANESDSSAIPAKIEIAQDERWLFCGMSGYGKSRLAKHIHNYLVKHGHRVVTIERSGHGFLEKHTSFIK
jgi:DNA replication protein DnaC